MIKLGMLDFDTSHAPEFARRLNHQGIGADQWVDGARVVIACPGESRMMPERIPGYRQEIAALGIPLVDRPEDMIGHVDGMLIESNEGGVHWERARPFLEAGIPCFIDKPFTCSLADARKLADLAHRKQVPIFSASSTRYAPELVQFMAQRGPDPVLGALTYGPALLQERNPGPFHYVIHAVEILYTLMGPGCAEVSGSHEPDVDLIAARWSDGRMANVRGFRPVKQVYGFLAFTREGIHPVAVGYEFLYRELLKRIVEMFQTGKAPLDMAVTLEIMAFLEAALQSASRNGVWTKLAPVAVP